MVDDNVYFIPDSVDKISDITEDKNFFVDEDKGENKLIGDNNDKITSPDLDEPNFNEIRELKSSIKYSLHTL